VNILHSVYQPARDVRYVGSRLLSARPSDSRARRSDARSGTWARPPTGDQRCVVFQQVFSDRQYDISRFPRRAGLDRRRGAGPGERPHVQGDHEWPTRRGADRCRRPFIIAIDIEGFESDLFAYNADWLKQFTHIEPHDWLLTGQNTSRSFQSALGREDFDVLLCGEDVVYVR
jgi:hypothetical protein